MKKKNSLDNDQYRIVPNADCSIYYITLYNGKNMSIAQLKWFHKMLTKKYNKDLPTTIE